MAFVKLHKKLHIRAAPLVDILIRVAHDHQIAVLVRQDIHQPHLHRRAVLKLVHHNVIEPVLPLLPHLGILFQQMDRKRDQIMEIQRIRRLLPLQEFLHDAVVLIPDLMQDLTRLRITQPRHVRAILFGISDLP